MEITFSSLDRFLAAAESATTSRELVGPRREDGGAGTLGGGFGFFVEATFIRDPLTIHEKITFCN